MCLINISERKTAGEDITCYKYLNLTILPNPNLKHGDEFSCKINKVVVTGKISIEEDKVYLCTDNPVARGNVCTEKFGYKYSWVWDYNISDFQDSIKVLVTPFLNFEIEIGETYSSNLYPSEHDDTSLDIGLHSLSCLTDCIECANEEGNSVVVECIIPKGAEYYEGYWDAKIGIVKGYASSQLKYVEIIEIIEQ